MRAVRVHEFGGREALRYEEVPRPEPGPGEARVKIEAIGVNFIDIYHRTGRYGGQLPMILGVEGAGVVDAVGPDVAEVAPGDRVAYVMQPGAYAEFALVPAWKLIPIPERLDLAPALAVMVQGLTAHYLTHSTYPLQPGETALVHAAAGGTGRLVVQLAKRRGARVIGTTSTPEKAEVARSAGADEVILYTETDFAAEARRLTGGEGVHVVYDSVGRMTFDKSLDSLRPRGYMVLFGASSGAVPPVDPMTLNHKGSLFLTRPTLRDYAASRDELLRRAGDLFDLMLDGELSVRIDERFALSDAAAAHRYLEERKTTGKVLLVP